MPRTMYFLFCALVITVACSVEVAACTCAEYGTPPCAAYARADTVFTGTILKIEEDNSAHGESWKMLKLEFAIEEPFKNISGKTVNIYASTGTSCSSQYEIGDQLLVYAHKDSTGKRLSISPCDRTTSRAAAEEDLAYIRQAVKGLSKETVSGAVLLNRHEPIQGIRIVAEHDKKRYVTKTDSEGRFHIDLPSSGNYTIRATVPFSAGAVSHAGRVEEKTTESQSVFAYTVSVPKGECDYRELHVYQVDLKATAQITGKVVGPDGKACPSVMVYLYKATADQDFSGGGYEYFRTDSEGRYSFEGLREGRFWLGVNLGRMPGVDSPYPTTFFPGVPDVATAAVVLLEQREQLELPDLRVPPKLVEREVTGIMLWPDGKSVTKLSPHAADTVGPVFSLYDPDGSYVSTHRLDGTWAEKTTPDGRFSFFGFEGYTYVIHVHAWDAKDKVMHTNVKVTIGPENKPLTLVLSKPGYGGSEDIKKEFGSPKQ